MEHKFYMTSGTETPSQIRQLGQETKSNSVLRLEKLLVFQKPAKQLQFRSNVQNTVQSSYERINQLLINQVGNVEEKLELIRIAKTYSIKEGVFYISDLLNTLLSKCLVRGWSVSQA